MQRKKLKPVLKCKSLCENAVMKSSHKLDTYSCFQTWTDSDLKYIYKHASKESEKEKEKKKLDDQQKYKQDFVHVKTNEQKA